MKQIDKLETDLTWNLPSSTTLKSLTEIKKQIQMMKHSYVFLRTSVKAASGPIGIPIQDWLKYFRLIFKLIQSITHVPYSAPLYFLLIENSKEFNSEFSLQVSCFDHELNYRGVVITPRQGVAITPSSQN